MRSRAFCVSARLVCFVAMDLAPRSIIVLFIGWSMRFLRGDRNMQRQGPRAMLMNSRRRVLDAVGVQCRARPPDMPHDARQDSGDFASPATESAIRADEISGSFA